MLLVNFGMSVDIFYSLRSCQPSQTEQTASFIVADKLSRSARAHKTTVVLIGCRHESLALSAEFSRAESRDVACSERGSQLREERSSKWSSFCGASNIDRICFLSRHHGTVVIQFD